MPIPKHALRMPNIAYGVLNQVVYAPGNLATFTLKNGSNKTVEYRYWDIQLEKQTKELAWENIEQPGIHCRAIGPMSVAPNDSVRFNYSLPNWIPQGAYRLTSKTPPFRSASFGVGKAISR